ncbi:MAG: DUF116 domain-containing protein [bacterium]|nr:DUF116 domain-containing protein [bacterium]
MNKWRLLDTGVREADENIALDEVILFARCKGVIPNTVRFLQFFPPAVLIGYHQSVEQEVREEFCKENGISINRRITGGGAIFFDRHQLGWELIAKKEDLELTFESLFRKICNAIIYALRKFRLKACFRGRNDIEISGRKISGTGGVEEGDAFLFQGTLLLDFDVVTMIKSLRIPTEKLKDKEIEEVKDRVTWIKRELNYLPDLSEIKDAIKEGFENVFGVSLILGNLTGYEEELYKKKLSRFKSDDWIYKIRAPISEQQVLKSVHKTGGGLIRTNLMVNLKRRIIQSTLITGDFFCSPKRTIYDLEASLKNIAADRELVKRKTLEFFRKNDIQIPAILPDDFAKAIDEALIKLDYTNYGISFPDANSIFTVNGRFEDIIRKGVKYLLLPYCAKKPSCEFRYRRECIECGECSVGDAYRFAEINGLSPITINSFEDLMEILTKFRNNGVSSYIGSCCEAFYVKHKEDFERSRLPAILIDIESETCYDLGKQVDAYRGKFSDKTELKLDLLKKVIHLAKNANDLKF